MTALKDKEINELQLAYNVLSFNGPNCINDLVKIDSVKDNLFGQMFNAALDGDAGQKFKPSPPTIDIYMVTGHEPFTSTYYIDEVFNIYYEFVKKFYHSIISHRL
jgi:hypothetical protein